MGTVIINLIKADGRILREEMEKILAFQIEDGEMQKLKRIAEYYKACLIVVEKEAYRQVLEDLLEQKRNPLVQSYEGDKVTESMIVMEGFTEKRLDKLLQALRDGEVQVDYKAVVTPFNKKWNVLQLYLEMERERAAIGALHGINGNRGGKTGKRIL